MKENPGMMSAKKNEEYSEYTVTFLTSLALRYTHLVNLADRKSGVLLGVCFIMVSLLITQISVQGLKLILVLPLLIALSIILLTVLALSPRVKLKEDQIENILFFGVAAQYSFEAYEKKLEALIRKDPTIYETLLIDCHQTAIILDRKYKYLKLSYKICMFSCLLVPFILLLAYLYIHWF